MLPNSSNIILQYSKFNISLFTCTSSNSGKGFPNPYAEQKRRVIKCCMELCFSAVCCNSLGCVRIHI